MLLQKEPVRTNTCRLIPCVWKNTRGKNASSIATVSNDAKGLMLCVSVSVSKLLQELNDKVVSHEKFDDWLTEGAIPPAELKKLWQSLKDNYPYDGLPERFARSVWLKIKGDYAGWFAKEEDVIQRLRGLNN